MFDTAIFDTLESAPASRRWTTAFSFLLQVTAITILLLIPLLYTDALPALHHYSDQLTVPVGSAPQRPIEVVDSHAAQPGGTSELYKGHLVAPIKVPTNTVRIIDRPGDTLAPPDPTAVLNSTGTGNSSSAVQRFLAANASTPPPRLEVRRPPVRISDFSEGALLRRVQPVYPAPARAAHVQGSVVMAALIDTEGRIANLHVVSGNPLLINAAVDAVKQWRYRPYILNHQPIEVETQITVVFTLN